MRNGRENREKIAELNLGPRERALYGAIVTAREQESGRLWTLCQHGTTLQALRSMAGLLDAEPGHWLIVSISCPQAIFRDMQGHRISDGGSGAHEKSAADPRSNERNYLAKIGRSDLLEPLRSRVGERRAA